MNKLTAEKFPLAGKPPGFSAWWMHRGSSSNARPILPAFRRTTPQYLDLEVRMGPQTIQVEANACRSPIVWNSSKLPSTTYATYMIGIVYIFAYWLIYIINPFIDIPRKLHFHFQYQDRLMINLSIPVARSIMMEIYYSHLPAYPQNRFD